MRKLEGDPKAREEAVLALWAERDVFRRSLAERRGGPRYVFYEGPPTANGRPHIGHLLARLQKDLFPRYKTMRGFYVPRKAGWDCHGLPVELEVEKELGISTKAEIERYGVEAFVERCKASVQRYIGAWEAMIRRLGFWIDLEHPYVTYSDDYIETLWWELKEIHKGGLLYPGHKILPYCPRCGTSLSSHEVAQGYDRVADPSVYVRMPLAEDPQVSFLVWTTTPWTLPANVALAVHPRETYAEVDFEGERLILARGRVGAVLGEGARLLREFPGSELVGRRYLPLYPLAQGERAYTVVGAEFVSMEEGTGIVHIAPAFGEEDHELGKSQELPFLQPVDRAGRFTDAFPLARGEFVKDADPKIIADLKARGRLFRAETIEHDYPFCWRCDTPLLYYAMESWFIATTRAKGEILAQAETIAWYPEHVGSGRFADFLASLRDWALSRDRYWGTPLPVWTCGSCGALEVVGSREELVARAADPDLARKVELHRPYIDRVELRCPCGGKMRRLPYVLDTWFDSGSMHTAQWHYPFENEDEFRASYPADFISEGLDQTRGWFYTLLVTGVLLHGKAPYRNVLVTGMGLDAQGQKMSKSRGNVLDPMPIVEAHGADAVRWYLASESAPWNERRYSEEGVRQARYGFLETVRNCHDFLTLYAGIDGFTPDTPVPAPAARPALDRWLLSRLGEAVEGVTAALDAYDPLGATRAISAFVDDLSNWYIRLSRPRFWGEGLTEDKLAAYGTLYEALRTLALLLAPFTPFLAEALWQSLRRDGDPDSVHLARWPDPPPRDPALGASMARVRAVASLALGARNLAKVKVRQPLPALHVLRRPGDEAVPGELWDLVKAEVNVREVALVDDLGPFRVPKVSPEFRVLGPRHGPKAPRIAAALARMDPAAVATALARDGRVSLPDEGVALLPDEVKVGWEPREGFALVEDRDGAVALDLRIDAELQAEGDLRELVHRLQLLRKEAGFAVTDRIELGYAGDLGELFLRFGDRIRDEVLAVRLEAGPLDGADHGAELAVHGRTGRVWLKRVGG
ncbi:MAG: isoleucine--tRNA ligase [Candidatus Bipolaricaulota bacterium]|nr:isoleucine--tRNA ligase [Candidatus Bipolaricaulota bacterium]